MNSIQSGAALLGGVLMQSLRHPLGGSQKNAHFAAAFEQSPNGGLVVDAGTLRIVGANEAMRRQLDLSDSELASLTLNSLFEYECEPELLVARLRGPNFQAPLRARHRRKDGRVFEMEVAGYPLTGVAGNILVFMTQDVSVKMRLEDRQLKKQERLEQLAHDAQHDSLTGLPNRLFLSATLPQALVNADRGKKLLAVLRVDIDRFKHINEAHGQQTGDRFLIAAAKRIRSASRDQDTVARIGGDEFIVVLSDLNGEGHARDAAVRMIEALSAPFDIDGRPVVTSASIGISLFPRDGADMEELLRHSGEAMSQAKERGRNTWQLFGPAMDRKLKRRMNIEAHLREAMRTSQLDVYYQPIVDIRTRSVVAMESLLRWQHPTYGLIPTESFIEIAEQTGLIVPIGELVFDRVCKDIHQWLTDGLTLVPVAINMSAVQIRRGNTVEFVSKRLRTLGVSAAMLRIELTEDTAFEGRELRGDGAEDDPVSQLRQLGIHVAIDEFGTGKSSLSNLKNRRVDSIKIDRSFVRDLATDPSDLAIVAAVATMARHLDIPVVAVGVESWQQLEKLGELGCSFAQGHLFSRPIPASRCHLYLSGESVDFASRNDEYASSEATGINPALLFESLEKA